MFDSSKLDSSTVFKSLEEFEASGRCVERILMQTLEIRDGVVISKSSDNKYFVGRRLFIDPRWVQYDGEYGKFDDIESAKVYCYALNNGLIETSKVQEVQEVQEAQEVQEVQESLEAQEAQETETFELTLRTRETEEVEELQDFNYIVDRYGGIVACIEIPDDKNEIQRLKKFFRDRKIEMPNSWHHRDFFEPGRHSLYLDAEDIQALVDEGFNIPDSPDDYYEMALWFNDLNRDFDKINDILKNYVFEIAEGCVCWGGNSKHVYNSIRNCFFVAGKYKDVYSFIQKCFENELIRDLSGTVDIQHAKLGCPSYIGEKNIQRLKDLVEQKRKAARKVHKDFFVYNDDKDILNILGYELCKDYLRYENRRA